MGTDIHSCVEVRQDGEWKPLLFPIFPTVWSNHEVRYYLSPFVLRNYGLFNLLAGVRGNGYNAIDMPRGLPDDMAEESYLTMINDCYMLSEDSCCFNLKDYANKDFIENEFHSCSWLSLRDFEDYIENVYLKQIEARELPTDIVKVVIDGIEYDVDEHEIEWFSAQDDFFTETFEEIIPLLRGLVPENGTAEDVRVIFSFDS